MSTFWMVLLLVLLVGWLTAAATAVRSVRRIWLRHWVEQQLSGAETAGLYLDRPQRWLLVAGTGTAAAVFATGAAIGLRESGSAAAELVAVAIALLMVVGQLVPRAIARRWAMPLVPVLMPVLRLLAWLGAPFLRFAARFGRHVPADPAAEAHAEHEALEDLLREGELEGVGEATESAIISGVVEFGEKRAAGVMTPRSDIVAVDRAMPTAEIARIIAQSKYSRLPVYDRDLDHIVGLVHSFDVLGDPEHPTATLRRVAVARATTPCHELMRSMLRDHVHLAIIQGGAGETLGVVTLEDLVEELVGDISDEHDDPQGASA